MTGQGMALLLQVPLTRCFLSSCGLASASGSLSGSLSKDPARFPMSPSGCNGAFTVSSSVGTLFINSELRFLPASLVFGHCTGLLCTWHVEPSILALPTCSQDGKKTGASAERCLLGNPCAPLPSTLTGAGWQTSARVSGERFVDISPAPVASCMSHEQITGTAWELSTACLNTCSRSATSGKPSSAATTGAALSRLSKSTGPAALACRSTAVRTRSSRPLKRTAPR
mmetsp:Transcript_93017/g.259176  ORF Transcript_93017/g.259176 Transcript_93017/m.259176 type:complete len:227 (-) Transcript_93017:453-1133(-)